MRFQLLCKDCLSQTLYICLSISPKNQFVCLSVFCLSVHLSACLFIHLSVCLFAFVYLSVCLLVCPSVCLFVHLSVSLSVCLFIHLFASQSSLNTSIRLYIYPSICYPTDHLIHQPPSQHLTQL